MVLGKRKVDSEQLGESAPPAAKKQQRPSYSGGKGSKGPAVLGRAERALLRKERRASKPHHELIENANQLYRFDFKRMEPAERRTKIGELMERTAGKVAELLTKHDTSRVFQLMVKYGSGEQRQQMAGACKGSLLQLCLNHYAHHFVLKLLQYGSPLVRQAVWREVQGHVSQLAFHADGAVVFDYLFASEKSKRQQQHMTKELLHPSFALDAQTQALTAVDSAPRNAAESSLADLCAQQPVLAAAIMTQVGGLVERWLNKDQLQYRFVHSIVRQYLELPAALLPRSVRSELLASLCSSPSLSALCGSNDGVLVLSAAVSDGAAKERKQVMRCLKSDALTVCRSMYGHLLLMRVADCVDDTVAVDKNVWSGLLQSPHAVSQLINDVHGAKVVRFMLHGKASAHFLSPFEASFQKQAQHSTSSGATDGSTEESVVEGAAASSGSGGSKKDSVLRHEEHLAHCLLPLLNIFQLDAFLRDNPLALTPAQVAAQAAAGGDRASKEEGDEEEADEAADKAASTTSLDSLLRSPAASPVLLEVLLTAQETLDAADEAVKATQLRAMRPQLQQALDQALDQLARALQPAADTLKDEDNSGEREDGDEDCRAEHSGDSHSSLLEDRTAHYFFKRLLAPQAKGKQQQQRAEVDSTAASASAAHLGQHFARRLLHTLQAAPSVLSTAASSNRGCFVLLALVDALDFEQQTALAQLCQQQPVRAAMETALRQHERQQNQPEPTRTTKRRKRTTPRMADKAATAAVSALSSEQVASETPTAVLTGCRLLQAWIVGRQAAPQTPGKQPGVAAAAASKPQQRQSHAAVEAQQRQSQANSMFTRRADSADAVSKRARGAASRN